MECGARWRRARSQRGHTSGWSPGRASDAKDLCVRVLRFAQDDMAQGTCFASRVLSAFSAALCALRKAAFALSVGVGGAAFGLPLKRSACAIAMPATK